MRRWVISVLPPSRRAGRTRSLDGGEAMHPYFVGLNVHKQVIAYCVKTADGEIVSEGKIPATRNALDPPRCPGLGTAAWRQPCSATGSSVTSNRARRACRWDIRGG